MSPARQTSTSHDSPSRLGVDWFSRRAILAHLALVVVFPGCLFAAWWQVNRALSGNFASYVYSIEWPIFAVYSVFFWWKLVHELPEAPKVVTPGSRLPVGADEVQSRVDQEPHNAPGGLRRPQNIETSGENSPQDRVSSPAGPSPGYNGQDDEDDDPERAAYNRYLKGLAQSGKRKTWRG